MHSQLDLERANNLPGSINIPKLVELFEFDVTQEYELVVNKKS